MFDYDSRNPYQLIVLKYLLLNLPVWNRTFTVGPMYICYQSFSQKIPICSSHSLGSSPFVTKVILLIPVCYYEHSLAPSSYVISDNYWHLSISYKFICISLFCLWFTVGPSLFICYQALSIALVLVITHDTLPDQYCRLILVDNQRINLGAHDLFCMSWIIWHFVNCSGHFKEPIKQYLAHYAMFIQLLTRKMQHT